MLRWILTVGCIGILTGCASTTGTFFNRPVVEDQVGDTLHTVSLSADRRTVIVAREKTDKPMFCAEPPPDTATSIKTDLDASLKARGSEASVKDKFDTSVTVLSARNAPLDAFRTGMFALCQFYMNGAIPAPQVPDLFKQLLIVFKETQNLVSESSTSAGASTPGATGGLAATNPNAASAGTKLETRKASK